MGGRQRAVSADRVLAALDGERFFLRCLLPVPVEHYGAWCVGLWIEVEKLDYEESRSARDKPERYASQRFSGAVANAVGPEYGLPVIRGTEVQLHVPDRNTPPQVAAPAGGELADLLSKIWPKADFEAYAVARGIL